MGARGLMQVMKRTARWEAKRLDTNYVSKKDRRKIINKTKRAHNLFDIETNIVLGVHYLAGLLNDFDQSVLALSAYNAGPTATRRWMKKIPSDDLLYFVEKIPYKETNLYVKLIVRNYYYYKKLYSDDEFHLPYLESLTKNLTQKIYALKNSQRVR